MPRIFNILSPRNLEGNRNYNMDIIMKNLTVCIQIGNSDDKLTQKKWSEFCKDLKNTVESYEGTEIHFASSSSGDNPWQNYCIVAQTDDSVIFWLKRDLVGLRNKYNQDSIAVLAGNTEFVK